MEDAVRTHVSKGSEWRSRRGITIGNPASGRASSRPGSGHTPMPGTPIHRRSLGVGRPCDGEGWDPRPRSRSHSVSEAVGAALGAALGRSGRRLGARGVSGRRGSHALTAIVDRVLVRRRLCRRLSVLLALLGLYRRARKPLASRSACVEQLLAAVRAATPGHGAPNPGPGGATPGAFRVRLDDGPRPKYLSFDPSEYRANTQMRMSAEAKRILRKAVAHRTPEEINYAMIGLRGLTLIAEYPVRMQRHLAKYGRFESYEPQRTILRQDHPPHAFYFIIYGSVSVVVRAAGEDEATVVCFLHRGHSFGELSIIEHKARQSSVVSKTDVELLSIDVETYESVFMAGGSRCLTDPDHTTFLRSLNFLRGWPIERLVNDPTILMFSYFSRGTLMVTDSSASQWIYIVKSGSARVIKKLTREVAQVNPKTGRMVTLARGRLLSNKPLTRGRFAQKLTELCNLTARGRLCSSSQQDSSSVSLSEELHKVGVTMPPATFPSRRPLPAPSHATPHVSSPSSTSRAVTRGGAGIDPGTPRRKTESLAALTGSQQKRQSIVVEEEEPETETRNTRGAVRTLVTDLEGNDKQGSPLTAADLDPVFVHVRTLTKGDTFGVESAVLGAQPALCLVSDGAECVLLRRTYYLHHCPPALTDRLRRQVSPYPSEDQLQTDLRTWVNWQAYRQATLARVVKATRHHTRSSMATYTPGILSA